MSFLSSKKPQCDMSQQKLIEKVYANFGTQSDFDSQGVLKKIEDNKDLKMRISDLQSQVDHLQHENRKLQILSAYYPSDRIHEEVDEKSLSRALESQERLEVYNHKGAVNANSGLMIAEHFLAEFSQSNEKRQHHFKSFSADFKFNFNQSNCGPEGNA